MPAKRCSKFASLRNRISEQGYHMLIGYVVKLRNRLLNMPSDMWITRYFGLYGNGAVGATRINQQAGGTGSTTLVTANANGISMLALRGATVPPGFYP